MRNLILRLAARIARKEAKRKYSDGYTSEGIDYEMVSRLLLRSQSETGY